MNDEDKTKEQLIDELTKLRRRIAALEASEAERRRTEEVLRRAHDELEMRVAERTAELAKVNEDLRIEITEHKRAEEKEKQHIRELRFLSKATAGLIEFSLEEDIYQFIGEKLQEIVDDSIVAISSFDKESGSLCIRAILGLGRHARAVMKTMGGDPVGMPFQIDDEAKRDLTSGKLMKVPGGIYGLSPGIPKAVSRALEKLLGLGGVYAMGFSWKGELFGDAVILMRKEGELKNRGLIETLIRQASVALQRGQVEEVLQESEEKYRNLVERAHDGITIIQEGIVQYANPRLAEMWGGTVGETIGTPFTDYVHPDELSKVVGRYERRMAGEDVTPIYETVLRRKDGRKAYVELSAGTITHQGKLADLVIVRDITERKQAEEALRASREYARNLIDSSLDMIIAVDMGRHIVEFNKAAQETFGYCPEEVLGKHVDMLYADPQEGLRVHETTIEKGQHAQEILDRRKNGQVFPAFLSASVLRDTRGELVGVMGVARDITERKRAEEALRRRNRELAMLNQAGRAFSSTLDLGQVLVTVLEEVRRLLDVVACSVWLSDPETDELVCRQATGPQGEIVRGWRLAPGEGIAGWVARHGESLIVPDTQADERHFKDVDRQTGLGLRSILTVPLRVRQDVIGVLQAVDTEVDRFRPADLTLLEPLAATAAIAIENAQLYKQVQEDAETKSMLLREVNHRVKNNLMAIIGLLYAERRRAEVQDLPAYQSAVNALINQVRGLSTVHSLLTASEWTPLLLSELTSQVIRSSLQMLPRDQYVSVEVAPSPVRVTPDQAHNLALIINELTTNTVKHTLQERDTARITVRIALEEGALAQFEFRDDGPGYPEEVLQGERENVGLGLVESMVHKGLRGELSLHNDDGAVALIQFE